MIETRALDARAGAFALRDISIALPRGAWGIVLGPAGAGKTTLLETIAGVRRVQQGTVLLRGDDVTHVAPEHRSLGIVYQHGYLFPHLSVDDNIRYGTRDVAYADAMAERLGASSLRDRAVICSRKNSTPMATLTSGARKYASADSITRSDRTSQT